MPNRIAEFRKQRRWSMRELAERIHTTPSQINKLEKGQVKLTEDWIRRISRAFDVLPSELLDHAAATAQGVAEDAGLYSPPPDHYLARLAIGTRFFYEVRSACLDELDIKPGDLLFVDMGEEAIRGVKTGDIVIAQLYDAKTLAKARTILRQFVEPALLTTNSRSRNEPPVNMNREDAHIKAVVLSSQRYRKAEGG